MIRRFYILIMICVPLLCLPDSLFSMVEIADTIPPVIISPAENKAFPCNTTIDLEEEIELWYNNFGGLVAQDDNSDTIIYSAVPDLQTVINNFNSSNGCGSEKQVSVDFFATDTCGNVSPASVATFSLLDNISPAIITHATPMTVSCTSLAKDSLELWINNKGGAIAEDECANIDWLRFTYSDNLGNAGVGFIGLNTIPIPDNICNWRVDVSFIVIDICENQGVSTSYFEIIDDVVPSLSSMPQDITIGCESLPLENDIAAEDNCTSLPDVNYIEEIVREGNPTDCSYYNYSIIRTWEASDFCGNIESHTQTVTVIDTIPPSFFLVDSVVVDCSEIDNPNATFLPTNVSDNCSNVITSIDDVTEGDGCDYTIDRIYTFSDICGNSVSAMQHITVSDKTPPAIIVPPSDVNFTCGSDVVTSFEDWYGSNAGGEVSEACGSFMSFAAVPGSYDIDDVSTYPGTSPGSLDDAGCGSAIEGYLNFEEVDFVFYDECENAIVVTAAYGISDNEAPVITSCTDDITIEADSGMCSVLFPLPEINVEDNCVETTSSIERSVIETLSSGDPGNENVIVDIVRLIFVNYNTPYLEITGDGVLDIDINRADINDPGEVFYVVSESGDTLGITNNSESQCGSSTSTFSVSKSILEQLIEDGDIIILLIPFNSPLGSDGINDICESSRVKASLSIPTNNNLLLDRDIIVNGSDLHESAIIDNAISLGIGIHSIDYVVADCGGNRDTCSFNINVIDKESPTIICPSDTTIILTGDTCSIDLVLPGNYIADDNCTLNKDYDKNLPVTEEGSLLSFNFNEDSEKYAAQNILLSYSDVFTIKHTDKDAELAVTVSANIVEPGQRIEIKGEDGTTIGILDEQNVVSCMLTRVNFTILKDQLNAWGIDGVIDISFIFSVDNLEGDKGVTPCIALDSDGPDGESLISARLMYSDAMVGYEVTGATILSNTDYVDLDTITFTGNAGVNTITLFSEDLGGNESSCSFQVNIEDNSNPKAGCKNAVVFLDPSGVEDLILDPLLMDNGSFDNCGIDTIAVTPSVFNCSQLGEEIEVTLRLWDAAGNMDSCSSTIMLRTEILEPTFEIGVCDNDTLRLIANVPPSSVEDAYTFLWTGPNFTSVLENPVITGASPENNGTYFLEITGFNGCISTGTVEVNVEQLSSPVITTDVSELCIGGDLLLTAAGQIGNVTYNWFEGTYPNGLLIESTEAPSLQITPSSGDHLYYLVINKDGCDSNPSPAKSISVVNPPIASVVDEFITVCRGDALAIGTEVTGDNLLYHWIGPSGYTSDKQFPDTIFNVSPSNEGIYKLIISLGSCNSDTASLQVTLFEKPETPEIIAGDVFCEGSSISLSVNNIPNADLYTWFIDGNQTTTTSRNTLVLNNASEELSGNWTVLVTEGQCTSDMSNEKEITVESELLISANNDGPGCEGDSIQLSTSFVPGANYSWTGPQGFTSSIQNPKIISVDGEYFVTVTTPSGCDGESSTILEVIVPPEITALSSDALECMDGMTDITLFPSVFPQGEYQYLWSGPADIDTSVVNPVITNASEENNGNYSLTVSNGSCSSEPRSIELDVTIIPEKPTIEGATNYCVDDTLILMAVSENPGTNYIWGTPQGQRFSDNAELEIPGIELVDMGMYSVAVEKGNCRSLPSDPIMVDIGSLLLSPSISSNAPICPGDTLKLFSTSLRDATYSWSGPNGFSSSEQNLVFDQADVSNEGNYVVSLSIGSCTEFSVPYEVSLYETPPIPRGAIEIYSLCETSLGDGLEICIDESTTRPGLTYLLYNNANEELLGSSNSVCFQIEDLSDFVPGSNFVYMVAEGENCPSQRSDLVRIDISSPPLIDAELENNPVFICTDSPATLTSIFGPPEVKVSWTAIDNHLVLSSDADKQINVSNLVNGENLVLLTYSTDICFGFSTDTAIIIVDDAPLARNDNYSLNNPTPVILDVFSNDFIPASAQVNILENPDFGEVNIIPEGIRYIPAPAFIGTVTFTYEICGVACEGKCAEATVIVTIGDAGTCVAPSIFTPNNDNVNDAFIVPCLYSGNYPDNKLQIYNQWGSIVFSAENYDNSWEGTYNGKPLPVGTYYYILQVDDISEKIIGFLILER